MREEIAAGATATIAIRILVDGVPSAGTATTRIQRASDGKWLDTDDTFKSFSSILFPFDRALVADANDTGRYAYAWNTGAITNAAAGDVYFATVDVTAPYAYTTTGEISTALVRHGDTSWTTAVVAGLATASALASLVSTVATLATSTALTTLSSVVTTVRKRLTNRRKLAADGTESIYDDDAVTVIATRVYTDVTGVAVTINAGEPARASAES